MKLKTKKPDSNPNPYKFDKKLYWDRRSKGLHGQVHPPGSPEQRYDTRKALGRMRDDQLAILRKGIGSERTKRQSAKKSL